MLITSHSDQAAFLSKVDLDPGSIRSALGNVPSGVAAICAEVNGEPVGFVASSFSVGISFDPPIVLFSAQNTSSTWPVLRSAERLGISILARSQEEACLQLASRSRNRFDGLETIRSEKGALFVANSACLLECTVVAEIPAGDHHIVLLQVRDVAVDRDAEPLIYHRSAFRRLTVPLSSSRITQASGAPGSADDWHFPALVPTAS
ncbi:MAG: Flavin reductase-like domain protein [Subtercola sp.]|nr:Flavin reductase-like domain protein [Subtercola sp.]